MPDWTKSMQQSYEYYTVDPGTWKNVDRITSITSCTISRDWDTDTLGSATIDIGELIGETYIRVYLVTVQNGITERFALGTFLVQTPSSKFDGKRTSVSLDAYTPLIELKENQPPLGYYIPKNENIMEHVVALTAEHLRAPVVGAVSDEEIYSDFVANTDDTWMSFLTDLAANAKFYFDLDADGQVLFAPKQNTASLQPVWTYTDDNASILYPEISIDHDLYGIPNVVEVIYSNNELGSQYYARVVNDDENSPISTVNRGREIVQRVTDPDFSGEPTQAMVTEYANQLLRELSTLEYTVSYKHGYCPVRIGDCVRIESKRANLRDVKARVISQSITCDNGCPVSEKAAYTQKLWR